MERMTKCGFGVGARFNAGAEFFASATWLGAGAQKDANSVRMRVFVAYFAWNHFALRRLWIRAPANTTNAAKQASAAAAT